MIVAAVGQTILTTAGLLQEVIAIGFSAPASQDDSPGGATGNPDAAGA